MRIDKFEGKKEISGPVSRNSARYRLTPVREFKNRSVGRKLPASGTSDKKCTTFFYCVKEKINIDFVREFILLNIFKIIYYKNINDI